MQQVASARAFPLGPVCFRVYTAPPKSIPCTPSLLPSQVKPILALSLSSVHFNFKEDKWNPHLRDYTTSLPTFIFLLPTPRIPLLPPPPPPQNWQPGLIFQLKGLFLSPLPSLRTRTHRWPLTTKAGCDSRRGEENRGIQEGEPWDVQLGDPGQAAEGRTLRPQHCALR